ncbi:MAG TPA: hypothetical protein VF743_01670 [Acidimicrobiales bacterium]
MLACSGDDDSAEPSEDRTTTPPTTAATTGEAARPTEVQQEIEDLLHEYDEITSEITADAAVAADRDHPLYDQLRNLMQSDSDMTDAVVEALVSRGRRGISQRPYEEGELPVRRELDGTVEAVSDTEVTFPICTHLSYRLYDGQDRQTTVLPGLVEPGNGTAVLVEGEWRISRFENVEDDDAACAEASP